MINEYKCPHKSMIIFDGIFLLCYIIMPTLQVNATVAICKNPLLYINANQTGSVRSYAWSRPIGPV
jgi:hypothetical protein